MFRCPCTYKLILEYSPSLISITTFQLLAPPNRVSLWERVLSCSPEAAMAAHNLYLDIITIFTWISSQSLLGYHHNLCFDIISGKTHLYLPPSFDHLLLLLLLDKSVEDAENILKFINVCRLSKCIPIFLTVSFRLHLFPP